MRRLVVVAGLLGTLACGCEGQTALRISLVAAGDGIVAALDLLISADEQPAQLSRSLPSSGGTLTLPSDLLVLLPPQAWHMHVVASGTKSNGLPFSTRGDALSEPHHEVAILLTLGDGVDGDLGDRDLTAFDGADFAIGPCNNGALDTGESDVDCGGSSGCGPCIVGSVCTVPEDCRSGLCSSGHCQVTSNPPNWLPVAGLPSPPRAGLAVATGADGGIYAVGGYITAPDGGTAPIKNVDLYLPDEDKWVGRTWLPLAVSQLGAGGLPDGRIVAAGGSTDNDPTGVSSKTFVYSPASDSWATIGDLPAPRMAYGGVVGGDGHFYAIGGIYGGTVGSPMWSDLTSILLPAGSWVAGTKLMQDRGNVCAALGSDGRLYAIAGQTSAGNIDSVEAYGSATGWQTVAAVPQDRTMAAAIGAPDGRIYLAGSIYDSDPVLAYAPRENVWRPLGTLPSAPRAHLGLALGGDGRIYAVGGINDLGGQARSAVEAYGPVLTLSTHMGAPSSIVQVTGSNFGANSMVQIRFGDDPTVLGTGMSDVSGLLSTPIAITLPPVSPGKYRLRAIDQRSQYPISTPFTVQ